MEGLSTDEKPPRYSIISAIFGFCLPRRHRDRNPDPEPIPQEKRPVHVPTHAASGFLATTQTKKQKEVSLI